MLYENRNLNGDCIKQHAFWEGRVSSSPCQWTQEKLEFHPGDL